MRWGFSVGVTLALFAGLLGTAGAEEAPSTVAEVQQTLSPSVLAEIKVAEANRPLVKRAPEWLSGPEPAFPESEKALGHHGRVLVHGLIGIDGHFRYARVAQSSRAPALDAIALSAASASTFRPAENAQGQPIAIMADMPMTFYAFESSDGAGAAEYTCRQFVRDMDWYLSFPENKLEDHYFYELIRGFSVTIREATGGKLESNEDYTMRFRAAIEACRARPDARFADVMKPEGDLILKMKPRS